VDGSAGDRNVHLLHTTVASDLDEAGDWNLQAYVENGWKLPGTQDVLHVDENIDIPVTP
jgi:hypothetical protein